VSLIGATYILVSFFIPKAYFGIGYGAVSDMVQFQEESKLLI
jgi:hypothetical protein